MSVIDASIWISAWLEDDANHTVALSWLEQHLRSGERVTVPALALAEVSGAVARRKGDAQSALEAARWLQETPGITLIAVDLARAVSASRVAARQSLRGADAIYVALAQSRGEPLATFDLEMVSRGRDVVEVVVPGT